MFIATLIAAEAMRQGDISAARDRMAAADVGYDGACSIVSAGIAYDIPFAERPEAARAALEGAFAGVDVVVQPLAGREKRLLVADMDSTMIMAECIDELADYAGIKPAVAAVTEAAMRGELDFAAALQGRVALLAGMEEATLDRCLRERVHPTPGGATLVRTMRARGATTVLVSGGFTHFAGPVGRALGFEQSIANRLEIADGRLTGRVLPPVVDAATKAQTLTGALTAGGIAAEQSLAVGDGANDLAMIGIAGLGVAFRAKPVVAAAADARIDHCDLTALLHAQGICRSLWVDD